MADTMAKETKISIKVIVDKVKQRVVYAEADHSFVDILFSFMTLPIGTIVKLLQKLDDKKVEPLVCINNLYQSLKDLPECHLATEECRFMLLNPISLSHDQCRNLKLKLHDDIEPMSYFICTNCSYKSCGFSLFSSKNSCIRCGKVTVRGLCSGSDVVSGVFVSDCATFIITDNCSVIPYTTAASFKLLTDLGITDTSVLEERKFHLGCEQILYLLKMALLVDSPFTHFVFNSNIPIPDVVGPRTTFVQYDFLAKARPNGSKMLLEVYLQKSTGKLLFTEAKEDFADFLFSFLSIPLGTVIGTLLAGSSFITCMDNLFKSISEMSVGRYLKSQEIKDMLVKPHFGRPYFSNNHLFISDSLVVNLNCFGYQLKDPPIKEQCFKQSGLFSVTDDLSITASSSYSSFDILNKLKVSVDDIEGHEINIGLHEGLIILQASLRSKSALSSVVEDWRVEKAVRHEPIEKLIKRCREENGNKELVDFVLV